MLVYQRVSRIYFFLCVLTNLSSVNASSWLQGLGKSWKLLKRANMRQHGQPPSPMRTQEKCGHFSSSMTLSCEGGYREGRVVCYWAGLSACHPPQNHSTVIESLHIIYLAQLHHEDPESIPASDSLQLWISRSCLEGTSKRCQVHVLSIRFPSYRPKNAKLFLLIFHPPISPPLLHISPSESQSLSCTDSWVSQAPHPKPNSLPLGAGNATAGSSGRAAGAGNAAAESGQATSWGGQVPAFHPQWDLGIYMSIIMNHLFV